jgi:hypothetical protein
MSRRAVDSRFVDGHLRKLLWPELKAIGFRRSGRTAWRDRPHAVQVVCIQSFNSYVAEGVGATTFSFGVPIGVFFSVIEEVEPMSAFRGDPTKPAEWYRQLRKHLDKGISQGGEWSPRPLLDRPDIWYVKPDGSNVERVVRDARDRILDEGIPWLERFSDISEARRALGSEGHHYAVEALSTLIDRPRSASGERG